MKRYNPELQRRSLENRQGKQQDFDGFVGKLKEYSNSSKPSMYYQLGRIHSLSADSKRMTVWVVAEEDEARTRAKAAQERQRAAEEIEKRREEIRRHSISGR